MERTFKTLIREDHKLGKNAYAEGRISGIMLMICDGVYNGVDKPGVAPNWVIPGTGIKFTTRCEPEQYEIFKNVVEKHYPGLCEFDYNG